MAKKPNFSVEGMDILGLETAEAKPKPEKTPVAAKKPAAKRAAPAREAAPKKAEAPEVVQPAPVGGLSAKLVLPAKRETKSMTKTFKIKPSIAEAAAAKAAEMGTSVNDVVNQLLKLWVDEG